MSFKVSGILIFLSVCGIVTSNPDRAVDCRKFVFAPLCRGVAAKRGISDVYQNGQDIYINDESFRNLLRNLFGATSLVGIFNDETDQNGDRTDKHDADSVAKINQQNRYNRLLKLILESRRSNSEKDNFPVEDFENL